jgi:hypothetical protein
MRWLSRVSRFWKRRRNQEIFIGTNEAAWARFQSLGDGFAQLIDDDLRERRMRMTQRIVIARAELVEARAAKETQQRSI